MIGPKYACCLTLPHNNDPHIGSLLKTLWKKVKMLVTSISSFSHNVFYPIQNNFHFSVTLILLSANAFNLDQSKILLLYNRQENA